MSTDLSAASSVSKNINYINEVVVTPTNPPIDLPNTVVIAQGFHAGTVDGSIPGLAGMVGCGITAAGFHGVNASHKLDYLLSARAFDYSGSAFSELGLTEAGELRIGNDVSANGSGALTGSSYLRYRPSTGIELVGSNISVSSGNYVWVGTQFSSGVGLADNVSVGAGTFSGIVATHSDAVTFIVDSSSGNLTVGANSELTFDVATSTLKLGTATAYLEYSPTGLDMVGGDITVSDGHKIFVGTDLNNGVGIFNNYEWTAGSFFSGVFGAYNNTSYFGLSTQGLLSIGNGLATTDTYLTFDSSTAKLLVNKANIMVRDGYIYAGDLDVNNEIDALGTGTGMWNSGFGAMAGGVIKLWVDSNTGTFTLGDNASAPGATDSYLQYNVGTSQLLLNNANIMVNSGGYVYVGDITAGHEIDALGTGTGIWGGGLGSMYAGTTKFWVDATTGTFAVGEDAVNTPAGSKYIKFDPATALLEISETNIIVTDGFIWTSASGPSSNAGIGIISSGLYAYDGTNITAQILSSNGTFQFGPAGKNIAYDGSNLVITGSNVNISSGNYVWVGTYATDGVGFSDAGLLATTAGVATAYIIAADGSFQFGKDTGAYIKLDSTGNFTYNFNNWATETSGTGVPAANADVTANSPQPASWLSSLVDTLQIANGSITAAKTAVAAIDPSTGNISANHIVASMIQADTITGDKIYGNTLAAINANLGHVTAGSIDASLITTGTLSVGRTEAKCTDANADQTSINTASNTIKVENSYARSGYNLHMYSGADIIFYSDAGNTNIGSLRNESSQLLIYAVNSLNINADYVYSAADLLPMTSSSYDIGSSGRKWNYVYANYIGHGSYPISISYGYRRYVYDSGGTFRANLYGYTDGSTRLDTTGTLYLPCNLSIGSSTHSASYNFVLHIWNGTGWTPYDAYIS